MNAINDATKKIMELLPTQQLRPDTAAHLRKQVYTVIFRHTAIAKEELLNKINELDRQLYIANKKIEDEAVDSAGFNK